MIKKQAGGKMTLDEDSKKKLYDTLKDVEVLPVNQGEVNISISPTESVGTIKIVSYV